MTRFLLTAFVLALAYLALTANLQPSNLAVGAALGVGVAALVRPDRGPLTLSRLPGAAWALAQYLGLLAVDMLKCGLNVAQIVLDPKLPIRPGIVAVRSGMTSEIGTALSAHALTLTPGEMVMEIGEDNTMYIHCLDAVSSGASADEAQTKRRVLLEKIMA
jgi:multicomponent Na+:H+ antiporter subunit E